MKIAIFTETYHPQINGVVTSTQTFVDELEKLGHEVVVMAPRMAGAMRSTATIWRFKSWAFPFQKEHRIIWPYSRQLRKFKQFGFDIIHIQTPFFMGHLGQFLSWKYRIPMVHTYHTYWLKYLHYFPLLPKRLHRKADLLFLSKTFCNRCDHVVVPSHQMKDCLVADGVRTPLSVIPTGIYLPPVYDDADRGTFRKQYHLLPNNRVFIFVGRLGQEKNVYFMLDCFARIHQQFPNTQFLIVGDGPEKADMMAHAIRLGIASSVVFTGYIDHGQINLAYQSSDIILFPSKTETQGLSLLEGLSNSRPALCLNAMGVKDIVTHQKSGFLLEESVTEFAEAAAQLLSDSAYYHRACDDARHSAEQFSAPEMAKKLVSIYQSLL